MQINRFVCDGRQVVGPAISGEQMRLHEEVLAMLEETGRLDILWEITILRTKLDALPAGEEAESVQKSAGHAMLRLHRNAFKTMAHKDCGRLTKQTLAGYTVDGVALDQGWASVFAGKLSAPYSCAEEVWARSGFFSMPSCVDVGATPAAGHQAAEGAI